MTSSGDCRYLQFPQEVKACCRFNLLGVQVQCQDKDCEDHWRHNPQGHFGHNKWAAKRYTDGHVGYIL